MRTPTQRGAKVWLRLIQAYIVVGTILLGGPPSWWPRWLPWPIGPRVEQSDRRAATTQA